MVGAPARAGEALIARHAACFSSMMLTPAARNARADFANSEHRVRTVRGAPRTVDFSTCRQALAKKAPHLLYLALRVTF
jgi:hypothetical protein